MKGSHRVESVSFIHIVYWNLILILWSPLLFLLPVRFLLIILGILIASLA